MGAGSGGSGRVPGVSLGRRCGIADDLPSPILELSRDGRLRFANVAVARLVGLVPEQRGRCLLEIVGATAGDRERLARRLARRRTSVPV